MARWDQAAAPWLACAGLPLGLASCGGCLETAAGACASPFVILSGAKDLLSAAEAAWGGKILRRLRRLRMTGRSGIGFSG